MCANQLDNEASSLGGLQSCYPHLWVVPVLLQPMEAQVPKYRKKPVVVEAVRWWPPTDERHVPIPQVVYNPMADEDYGVHSDRGFMSCRPGDWIVQGVAGEFYPCPEDIFEATYELEEG